MSERIEQIISNIEQSFNKLNTSVEQLQKAENVASTSVATTNTLITEFKSSIQSIEKLIKTDFAIEYNKLADLNNKLLEKINKIDFDNKFQTVEQRIIDKNFDAKFNEVKTQIEQKNFDDKFSNLNFAITKINFDNKFQSVEQKITDNNFDPKFQSIQDNFETLAKENRKLKNLIYIVFVFILISALATILLPKII